MVVAEVVGCSQRPRTLIFHRAVLRGHRIDLQTPPSSSTQRVPMKKLLARNLNEARCCPSNVQFGIFAPMDSEKSWREQKLIHVFVNKTKAPDLRAILARRCGQMSQRQRAAQAQIAQAPRRRLRLARRVSRLRQ